MLSKQIKLNQKQKKVFDKKSIVEFAVFPVFVVFTVFPLLSARLQISAATSTLRSGYALPSNKRLPLLGASPQNAALIRNLTII